jgi:hypothetical protein
MADYDDEDCVCAKCHEDYSLGENCEPSKYCNYCVHDVVEAVEAQLSLATAEIALLRACVEAAVALDLCVLDGGEIDRRPELSAAHGDFEATHAKLKETTDG